MGSQTIYKSKKTTSLGRIYKKWSTRADGTKVDQANWTVRYKRRDYATGSPDPKEAERKLLQLAGDDARDKPEESIAPKAPGEPVPDVVLMNELFDDRAANARRRGNKDWRGSVLSVDKNLRPFFGILPAATLTTSQINAYVDKRLDADAEEGTINRELALLKRSLNLGVQHEPPKILRFPKIQMLKGATIREGFMRHPDYLRLRDRLDPHLAQLFIVGYHVGNRRGELLQVEIQDVEMDAQQPQFRLYPDATKSEKGRVVPIYNADMRKVFDDQIQSARTKGVTWIFHDEDGNRIRTFYKSWKSALRDVGLDEGILFHDLRRTAVRNLIRAGVDRKIAKLITGHKTDSVFDRYDITDEQDIEVAATKMANYINRLYAQIPQQTALVC